MVRPVEVTGRANAAARRREHADSAVSADALAQGLDLRRRVGEETPVRAGERFDLEEHGEYEPCRKHSQPNRRGPVQCGVAPADLVDERAQEHQLILDKVDSQAERDALVEAERRDAERDAQTGVATPEEHCGDEDDLEAHSPRGAGEGQRRVWGREERVVESRIDDVAARPRRLEQHAHLRARAAHRCPQALRAQPRRARTTVRVRQREEARGRAGGGGERVAPEEVYAEEESVPACRRVEADLDGGAAAGDKQP
mmetsp:Transcript_10125/g.33465  ORF Transcript_10125/g.33465 Transcript_10125/m.33465 type:complete len:256 (-) Transcript_10125:338-1105(-)